MFLAAAMLVSGETWLNGRLGSVSFLIFWLGCLGLTGGAIFLALVDLRAQRQKARRAERELLETALQEIQAEAQTRADRPKACPAPKTLAAKKAGPE